MTDTPPHDPAPRAGLAGRIVDHSLDIGVEGPS